MIFFTTIANNGNDFVVVNYERNFLNSIKLSKQNIKILYVPERFIS